MASKTLEIVCDLLGTSPEFVAYAFDFSTTAEVLAGATVASGVVEFEPLPVVATTPPQAAPATAYGLTLGLPVVSIGNAQVQVPVLASLQAAGYTFALTCTATLSGGSKLIRRAHLSCTQGMIWA